MFYKTLIVVLLWSMAVSLGDIADNTKRTW